MRCLFSERGLVFRDLLPEEVEIEVCLEVGVDFQTFIYENGGDLGLRRDLTSV